MRLSELQALTPKLQVIAERYGASNIAVFGSVSRDEATEASDVDLLVDLPPGTSLFEHAEFKQDLESLLQHNVDLIRWRNLKPGEAHLQDALIRCLEVMGQAVNRMKSGADRAADPD